MNLPKVKKGTNSLKAIQKSSPKSRRLQLVRNYLTKNKKRIVLGLVAILLLSLLYIFKGLFIVALVNGKPVTRLELAQSLEKKAGKQALDEMISKKLLSAVFAQNNIILTSDELNAARDEVKKNIEAQGGNLEGYLSLQGITLKDLDENLKIQKSLEKYFDKDLTVSDDEIKTYFDQNKSTFAKDAKLDDVKASIVSQLKQQKLSDKFYPWFTDLKSKASIKYFVNL